MFDNYDLSRIVLFDGLDTDEIKHCGPDRRKGKKYRKNDIIISEGEIIDP